MIHRSLTQAKGVDDRCKCKLTDYKQKYHAAWLAWLSLLGSRERISSQWLADADVVALHGVDTSAVKNPRKRKKVQRKPEDLILHGEFRRKLSWIWSGVDISEDSEAMKEALRIEWCKAYARKRRWTEELELVEEEMRRVPLSLEHKAQAWEGRRMPTNNDPQTEGINAYCNQQAALRQAISGKILGLWTLPDPVRKTLPALLPRIEEESEEEGTADKLEG
ncbi:hypothetical protein V5O48_013488 [Marasmius crinis-equi]|uniref:Uncharacterized protein n=1 Tax=Marasmius crinis-equi TaxID=585013 RepID=A0ABR3EZX5_9AGAR